MAITSGFFNSLDGDRKYNAEQMSEYYRGIISDGVVQNYKNALQVQENSGMDINVLPGRAYIDSRWMEVDATEILTITSSHVTLNRYTAVVVKLDMNNREMILTTVDGTAASTPTKPNVVDTETVKYLILAYVYVGAGATAITQANITDNRANTAQCGYVSGLINQVDTSVLFEQWEAGYAQAMAEMEDWQADMQEQFEDWFETLTGQLQVNTYIEEYTKQRTLTPNAPNVALNMSGYVYSAEDIIYVYLNGLLCVKNTDYTIDTSGSTVYIRFNNLNNFTETHVSNIADVRILKSKIGFSTLATPNGDPIVTNNNEEIIA